MARAIYIKRREKLLSILKSKYSKTKNACILLFADFENARYKFRQESSFYYLTGIEEPGVVLFMDFDGNQILYLPNYDGKRSKWMNVDLDLQAINLNQKASQLGFNEIKGLGKACKGYSFPALFIKENYKNLLSDLEKLSNNNLKIFTLLDEAGYKYVLQQNALLQLLLCLKFKKDNVLNLAPHVDLMRKTKDEYEIDLIKKAIDITCKAHQNVVSVIKSGKTENEIKSMIESTFTSSEAIPAFPSIVATGKNTTILHYVSASEKLKKDDLVLLDIGAEYKYYASDLTRTYPVSGKFSKRQLEVYQIVLNAQKYIARIAKPGMFLNNPDEKEKSLHHLAIQFFAKHGYEKFFIHGIGHMLGIDVHDSGNFLSTKLEPGDIFTIEPGLYIPQENIGIRIEDDYLMKGDGAQCLSGDLFKTVQEIENLFQKIQGRKS